MDRNNFTKVVAAFYGTVGTVMGASIGGSVEVPLLEVKAPSAIVMGLGFAAIGAISTNSLTRSAR